MDTKNIVHKFYNETVNSNNKHYKNVSMKCMDLWDVMFEKQIDSTRKNQQQLMCR